MISKNQIQHIKSLTISKFRKMHGEFIAEGPKIIDELLNSSFKVKHVFALEEWINAYGSVLQKDISIVKVSEKELDRISNLKNPNQVLAVVEMPTSKKPPKSINDLTLMLDNISDPGNMGTIIRTADWFGIKTIICSENCVDIYNPKVVQATMGSIFRVNIHYIDLEENLKKTPPGPNVYGTFQDGKNIYHTELDGKGIVVIGNESKGISANLHPFITEKISIPSYSAINRQSAESLNASIASAIICAEFRRQSK